jgi:cellulose synthase/poly-beta-1,6-N-acetylglucosamine synthase-like glycosyltransferase
MLLGFFLVGLTVLAVATTLLLTIGHRVRFASRVVGTASALLLAYASVRLVALWWKGPSVDLLFAGVWVAVCMVAVVFLRPVWNPIGQTFFGALVAATLTYLAFGTYVTFGIGLSLLAALASGMLLVFEVVALGLSISFTFESCDVICRVRWPREIRSPDPDYLPFVSMQIAAYNEPAEMLIQTIASVEALDYPNFEIVVIDDNTPDPATWEPVRDYCAGRPRVRFVHVEGLPGYKAGALNLVLRDYTSPEAEIVGVVDADYLLDPMFLRRTVGYFADPDVAFVQSPQDYRGYEGDPYLTACYDSYRYFFTTTMPSRNQRNSIIFAGTMGLLRRPLLERLGGWNEWCITEDAETSLRLLKKGYSGVYVASSYGRGIMPLTFASFKSQRFRWCFGGMQILRMHWRDLMPWDRSESNHLSMSQRLDYLLGGVQWMNDLVYLGFTAVLLASVALLLRTGHLALRPLVGAAVLLPAVMIASGLIRAVWALRLRTHIGTKRAFMALANWLSVSWTVAVACVQGLVRRKGVFLRTPKTGDDKSVVAALLSARTETLLAVTLWGALILVVVKLGHPPLLSVLLLYQGGVYACAPYMSWLSSRTVLTGELERRRRTEYLRDRLGAAVPYLVGAAATGVAILLMATLMGAGAEHMGPGVRNPFAIPPANAAPVVSSSTPTDASPSASLSPAPSPSILVSGSPGATPTAAPPSPSVVPSTSPAPSPPATSSPAPSTAPSATVGATPS